MSQSKASALRILVVDDDEALGRSLQIQLEEHGHAVTTCMNGRDALRLVGDGGAFDLLFLDLRLPDQSGLRVLKTLQGLSSPPDTVMITGVQDMKSMIEAIQVGAFDYVRKPLALEDVLVAVEKCIQRRSRRGHSGRRDLVRIDVESDQPHEIVGQDRKILDLLKQVGLLSRSKVTVLIQGESGTGKDLVARAIHNASSPSQPFIAINSAAIVPTLLESELFGHERGAFTGADTRKIGRLEQAGNGTVFLDEIGDMPMELQAKLLRTLQDRCFERVGGNQSIPFEARVLAASHRDLDAMVADKEFREDLLYRLSVARLQVPPLRDRPGDVRPLAIHLLHRIRRRLESPVLAIAESALQTLEGHAWPGNVRELENALTRAVAVARTDVIEAVDLPDVHRPATPNSAPHESPLRKLSEVERDHVKAVLDHLEWNITRSAQALDISPTTLRKKIADYGLR
ncbi:MAG: sigma-54-dependent Fis family transcriptional regulator [Planctomycetes bacterium]|jgi:two-component system response regulator AtoC|nr:sigma-54-dependent Fis family transcriptional regulator [Planctomycetota bacterium]